MISISEKRGNASAPFVGVDTPFDQSLFAGIAFKPLLSKKRPFSENLEDSKFFLDYVFGKALMKRFTGNSDSEHIYLKKYDIPQIELFNLLTEKFPLVRMGHECANHLLADFLGKRKRPVLMDIGMGTGKQLCSLLKTLAKTRANKLAHLTIIGMEPFSEALAKGKAQVDELAQSLPFGIDFIPFNGFIEKTKTEELLDLIPKENDGIIVNASFALHHIQRRAERLEAFQKLFKAGVDSIVLTEPHADHMEPVFTKRFENCLHHYRLLFNIIDNLDIKEKEKGALKLFFSREVEDVIGKGEEERVERHDLPGRWIDKLRKSGFEAVHHCLPNYNGEMGGRLRLSYHRGGYWQFEYEGESVISLMHYERKSV